MLVIRLQRGGKKNQPFFRIVITEKTTPVKGKFLEKLGFFNPLNKEVLINEKRIKYWISKGAKISDSVYNILINKKILEGKKRIIKITKKKEKEKKTETPKETKRENEKRGIKERSQNKEVPANENKPTEKTETEEKKIEEVPKEK